jgi:hypothetical protein
MYPTQKAWSYLLETGPATLAVPLAEVKTWLKVSGSTLDDEITALIESATLTGERITKRDFINKTYKTFRDNFSDYPSAYGNYSALIPATQRPSTLGEIELKRSKLQSVTSVKYLKSDVLTTVATSVYYATEEIDFSSLALVDGQAWPTDVDNRKQAVEIIFVAGYGDADTDVPSDIRLAIKKHVASAFVNRGDCDDERFLPSGALATYMNNRIEDIVC